MIGRRRAMLGATAFASAAPSTARAADPVWPARPIILVVASAAGGALDATGRVLAPRLAALVGQSVVIDNRGGGGGILGVEVAARAPADGHTLLLGHLGVLVISPLIRSDLAIDTLGVFAPVSLAVQVPSVLVVPAARPWRSLNEVLAAARARPGALTWGHSGLGSTNHLSGALLDRAAGIETVGVPYRGGGPLALDLIAGRLDYSFATSASILPHIEAGRLRALATPSLHRTPFLPEVPTVAEAAGLLGFERLASETCGPLRQRLSVRITRVRQPCLVPKDLLAAVEAPNRSRFPRLSRRCGGMSGKRGVLQRSCLSEQRCSRLSGTTAPAKLLRRLRLRRDHRSHSIAGRPRPAANHDARRHAGEQHLPPGVPGRTQRDRPVHAIRRSNTIHRGSRGSAAARGRPLPRGTWPAARRAPARAAHHPARLPASTATAAGLPRPAAGRAAGRPGHQGGMIA